MKTLVLIEIEHTKPLPKGLTDVVAERAYTYIHAKGSRAEVNVLTVSEQEQDRVVEANVDLLRSRSKVGIEKYGVTLEDAGLPRQDLIRHALEEALDLANYLQTLLRGKA